MQTFLAQAAQKIVAEHPNDLQNVLVLLPNKRGELFLKRAISSQISGPVLAPAMQTIEEFVQEASGFQKQSQLQLLMTLFTVYTETVNAAETFDNFIKWGNMLLHDFNEIDRHMVDAHQLFNNLLDAKVIESWGVEPGNETELMANFLAFWKSLKPLYNAYNKVLDSQQISYQGKAYRKVADDLSRVDALLSGHFSGIYLLGFNALNKAEENIFQHLISAHGAQVLWDADSFYMHDPLHEAGDFLRKYKQQWRSLAGKEFLWQGDAISTLPKKVQIISAPGSLGMAAVAGRILNQLPAEEQVGTGVVLADESMLLPMLDAVPAAYNAINVTMGLPLKHAPLAHDVMAILRLHEQAERTAASGNSYSFHHRPFLAVIESALFKQEAKLASNKIIQRLTSANSVFLSPKSAREILKSNGVESEFWQSVFEKPESALKLIAVLDRVILNYAAATENENPINRQSAFTLHQMHQQLLELLSPLKTPLENRTLLRLYQSMLSEQQIDFYGEPLAGLQIMGMLETRTLDFKRVIITSMNEGILPAGKSQNSFIPYDLKGHFEMPTHQEKDAVYAYHFYRLLQRAEEVWLIYDSDMKGVGAKEKSRFILQIENEFNALPNVTLLPTQHYAAHVKKESLIGVPQYQKDESVLLRLWELAEKGFSPSALGAYLADPAQFYVERLLRVNDPDEIAETIGHDVLGNVVHTALETLYTPFVKAVLSLNDLKSIATKIEEAVLFQLAEHYKGSTAHGRNLLIKNVAIHMVKKVVEQDVLRVKALQAEGNVLTILALEQELSVSCEIEGLEKPIHFRGFADRIDREANTIYILDYKTGFIDKYELGCKDMDQIFDGEKKKGKAFQVLFYAWMFAKNQGLPAGGLEAGLFSTRLPSKGFDRLKIDKQQNLDQVILDEFENSLFALVQELFEATKSFAPRFITLDETN